VSRKGQPVHRRRPQSERGAHAYIFRTKGSSNAEVGTYFAKISRFFENYDVSTRTRGRRLRQCGHFSDRWGGMGSIIRDFVGTSFMESPKLL